MSKILVVNCGSSSIKYHLFGASFKTLLEGTIEKIGEKGTRQVHIKDGKKLIRKVRIKNHKEGILLMLKMLCDKEWGAVGKISEITAVGHRVVHGGRIAGTTLACSSVLNYLKSIEMLAPLHNPHNVAGIRIAKRLMPGVPQVMVFDTGFHQTMPPKAFMYGLPYEFYEKYAVRKYGFHGTSHKYVSLRAAGILERDGLCLITCHLGAGSSIAAVKQGKSIDTSMGMTPLEGIMMGTRSGDIDPAILQFLVKKYKFDYDELFGITNNKSGLLGISGISKDIRAIEEMAKKGDKRCKLALEMFCYRAAKYIGAYAVALGKVDAIVFTGGIGENSANVRAKICSYLHILGAEIDQGRNKKALGIEADISAAGSKVRVLVIPTNEELAIAHEVAAVVRRKK